MNLKSEPDPDGPHKLPYNEQSRCVVKGQRLDGGACTVVLIRDRAKRAWVLYPHGVAGLGVRVSNADACTLADHILGGPS
jgi:hypothetical protein